MYQLRTIAATVLLVCLAGAACSSETPDVSAADAAETTVASGETSTSSEVPNETTEPTPSEETDEAGDVWDDIDGWSGWSFGTVRTIHFEAPFTFNAPEGSNLLCLTGPTHTGITTRGDGKGGPTPSGSWPSGLVAFLLADATVDATVSTIADGVAEPTEPQPTDVGGALGLTFDGAAPESAGTLYLSPEGGCTFKFDIAERLRFWVVDVDGVPVTLALYAPAEDFDAHLAELQPVVDSIEWRALGDL